MLRTCATSCVPSSLPRPPSTPRRGPSSLALPSRRRLAKRRQNSTAERLACTLRSTSAVLARRLRWARSFWRTGHVTHAARAARPAHLSARVHPHSGTQSQLGDGLCARELSGSTKTVQRHKSCALPLNQVRLAHAQSSALLDSSSSTRFSSCPRSTGASVAAPHVLHRQQPCEETEMRMGWRGNVPSPRPAPCTEQARRRRAQQHCTRARQSGIVGTLPPS
ncbi:hypothetical protein FA09DRAFT_358967, partial [Tilletiopsis washingtonensis]